MTTVVEMTNGFTKKSLPEGGTLHPIIPLKVEGSAIVACEELDKAVMEIAELTRSTRMRAWHQGKAILRIYETKLWNLRKTEEGKQAYKTFDQFISAECGISTAYAYSIMDVAKVYTEEEVDRLGPSKLSIICKSPPEVRDRLLSMASNGTTYRGLLEESQKSKKKKPVTTRNGKKVTNSGRPMKKDGEITVAVAIGDVKIPLFKTPMAQGESAHEPAVKIETKPWCKETLTNNVIRYYQVTQSEDGTLYLHISTERQE